MPWYRNAGKILTPLTDADFDKGMREGTFIKKEHKAFVTLLYYSAVRKREALRAQKGLHLRLEGDLVVFDVGKRLKHGKLTPPLIIPIKAPYVETLAEAIDNTKDEDWIFPFSDKTGYNIVHRAFQYPHLFRLSRITNFFLEGWTIPQVQSWTGLTLNALNYYIGSVDIKKMGESLGQRV